MNDEAILELISRSLDEQLPAEEQARLSRALAGSAELRALAGDLATIKALGETPVPACPPGVLERLEEKVARRYPRRRFPFTRGGWVTGALAAAALLLMALAGLFSPQAPVIGEEEAQLLEARAEVEEAQQRFHMAIARMERLAHQRLAEMPLEVAEGYARNLEVINTAIRDCERMAQESPGNGLNFAALSQAYQAKVSILEMIIEG
jgi:anti-sigma factor RsiW